MSALVAARSAIRALVAAPVPSALCVLTLALGVGANVAIFSAVRGVLLSPLPYTQPERVVQVWTEHRVSPQLYTLLEERLSSVSNLDASRTVSLALLADDEAWEIPAGEVTGAHFPLLGAQPALGRTLHREDQRPGAEPVAVLSHGLWQRRFGGDPAVLGRQVQLGDAASPSRTVVGVMRPEHRPLENSWQAWIPLVLDPRDEESWSHNYGLRLHARLRDGSGIEAASAQLRTAATELGALDPTLFIRSASSARVERLLDVTVGDLRAQLLLLAGAVGLVLLVACANVANLLLARGVARQRELSIRAALGATAGRLVRQLLVEGALLGLAGGAAGVLLAAWLVARLGSLSVDLARVETIRIDAPMLALALAVGVASSLLAGLVPAIRASRADLQEGLADAARSGASAVRRRLHSGLVILEVAVAVVLVIGAGLLLRSALRLQSVDPGFRYESLLALRLSPPPSRYATGAEITSYYERVLERLARVPGVESAGAAALLPLAGGRMGVQFELDGKRPLPGEAPARAGWNMVSGDFFQTLGVPLVSGRWLEGRDGAAARPAPALVNRAFVEEFFPGVDPIGHRLTGDGEEWLRIVGVVGDVRERQLDARPAPSIYVAHGHDPSPRLYVAVRTSADPGALVPAIGAAVAEIDPLVPITRFSPMSEIVGQSLSRTRLFTALLAGFAALALVLGAVGIYGVVSYGVSQRTREIGLRMALGADRRSVLREVLRGGLRPVAIGLLAGLVLAGLAGRLLSAQLYDVKSHDPLTFGAVAVAVLLVGALATLGPARRAAGLDPTEALRAE